MPIELKFAKPHGANVAMVTERGSSEDYAEDCLERSREPRRAVRCEKIVNASEDAIQQRNQREKRNQHRGDVQREVKAIGRPFGGGTSILAMRIVPGAVTMTAASRRRASIPNAM